MIESPDGDVDERPNAEPVDAKAGVSFDVAEQDAIGARLVRVPPVALPATVLALRLREHDLSSLPRPLDPRLVLLNDPTSTRAASFRALRDTLSSRRPARVIAVASAAAGDGKTTCAANLALAFAERHWTKVLLVDGNFFAPEVGSVFGIERLRRVALRERRGELAPHEIVQVTHSLHLCAIRWKSEEPVPRVDPTRFDAMMDQLSQMPYDHIFLDTPALRGTPLTIPILSSADGTLLVVKSGTTTGRDIRRATEQLPPEKALGVVLMDAPSAD